MSKTARKRMIKHLHSLGIDAAIADRNASTEGNPAILLRWNGVEEYYTGRDIGLEAHYAEYQEWLINTFANR